MKLVMTLLVRDEADIVDAQIAFHLNAGVDFVVATDNRSEDGTTEILERYAREGLLHLIREPGDDLRQSEWVTRMARLAATEFGADWVLNTDADEFWWPRGGELPGRCFAAVPARFGVVRGAWRNFVPRPGRRPLLRGADDGAAVRAVVPSASAQHALQVRASRRAGRPRRAREPRGVRDRARRAARLVPDRDPPLPGALARALPAEVRHAVRRARAERREGHPGSHGGGVPGVPRGRARRLLRAARRRRRRRSSAGVARRRARGRHAAARPAARARVRRAGRSGCVEAAFGRADVDEAAAFAGEYSALQEADLGLALGRVDGSSADRGLERRARSGSRAQSAVGRR